MQALYTNISHDRNRNSLWLKYRIRKRRIYKKHTCFAASISLPWATNSLFNVLALFSCSSTVFGSAPIGSEITLVALGSASRNHVRALSKASRYSRWRPPTPDNRSDNPLARESKSRYCAVTTDTSLRTTESCEGSMWGNRCGRLVRNSFKYVRYSYNKSEK